MTRILCLWLPNWPIQRLLRARPELKSRAVVLASEPSEPSEPATRRGGCPPRPRSRPQAKTSRGRRVAACCSAAAAQGIRCDMPLAEAKSLVRALAVAPYDPRHDCQALMKLAEACERFSPSVALEEGDEPESLLLDVSNLTHLLGTDAELAARVKTFFDDRHYRTQIAVADTVGMAWAVAHYLPVLQPPVRSPVVVQSEDVLVAGKENCKMQNAKCKFSIADLQFAICNLQSLLTQLPVEALRIADDTAAVLHQLGLETVGQLLPLAREELASRFGGQLLRRLDQLTGAVPEVVVSHRAPAALEVGCALEHPTADRAALAHVLAQLVEQLARHLAARDRGAVLLVCLLECAKHQTVPLRIGLAEPSASATQLMELVGLHLETVVLADEVARVEIRVAVVGRLGERQGELFADSWPSDPHQLAVLVNRLSSRLGAEQVLRAELRPSPLPERAFRYLPATEDRTRKLQNAKCKMQNANLHFAFCNLQSSPRPLLLYPEPRSVEVISVSPDGPPQAVWLDGRRQRIAQHWGPERIETRWWAGASVRRDYWRVATESGSGLWLFRRLADGRWFLHGIFA